MDETNIAEMTAEIVSAFVANRRVTSDELPQMIAGIGQALSEAANPPAAEPEVQQRRAGRKITRRRAGQVIGQQGEGDQGGEGNAPIVDEREATEQLIEDVAEDRVEPQGEAIPDNENVIGEATADEENGFKIHEPMFQD